MELHVVLPAESPAMDPSRLTEFARRAEDLGYEAVWLPDHPLPPEDFGPTYGGVHDPLVALSYLAAATDRIRLGTSVLILPLRDPFVVAKQAATLDRLSGGRFTLGVGIGWERREFTALGADFAARAARTDEAIRLMRHLWETGRGPFDGAHYRFSTGVFEPRPVHVPILVGGMSEAALARAAELADIWQSVPTTPEHFTELAATLRRLASRPIGTGARAMWKREWEKDPGLMAAELAEWEAAGADHLAVWFGEHEETVHRMTALAAARG
ncbi:TIGR03619 family F420-dependent LLM class oxidoreductase [Actinomadura alba]|uniref:TIGR03619 family F420-dependent LLM class oxidoreductase n=1 Tax=Actinomadura alba TaxID=406431 RepID=A0ABR7LNS9_9ACTN|nr:TIGR03619 family F420-dependent LLM class oxidoreductase [Actinomadura alba]MBC6466434.1 TIGR03619 family F420-dependent LLM class oxidoreductase [Actinomadura alba]